MTEPAKFSPSAIDNLCIETIRFLSMDGVQAANSGHPGMPMGMAATAYTLWNNHLRFNPKNPKWHNRDRFVLSAGHGSMLIYSLLHLFGYDLPLEQLTKFRQWDSLTPGHPEFGHTAGIEATTGPLGQGIANAVGMAIAQKHLAATFNKPGFDLFDYNIYSICGDGCLQEGVSAEASSLAGHLGLDNLIVIYDDNNITIDGETELSFTEDVTKRYEAYGWNVLFVDGDGTDIAAINAAIEEAKADKGKPHLIRVKSVIGFGSPNKAGSESSHGAPLGEDEIKLIKTNFGWDPEKKFVVPAEVAAHTDKTAAGATLETAWNELFEKYAAQYPQEAAALKDAMSGKQPIDISAKMPKFEAGTSLATRVASGKTLSALMPSLPMVMGGSADLTPSNNTWFEGASDFQKATPAGRYIRYGVREHAMGAIMNGISVSGLLRAYGATFLVFADYMRPAMRVAALSKYPTIFVFTHDSIGLGEDGPTHQPVETLASLRCIPGLKVFRPADANETAAVWKYTLENTAGPVTMALTRQGLPALDTDKLDIVAGVEKGAYVVVEQDNPDVVIIATGSEVSISMTAAEKLAEKGIKAQVVSMPCCELFDQQPQEYKDSVLRPDVKAKIAVEAAVEGGWRKYIGTEGAFIGMSSFGASAPAGTLFEKFGITTEAIVAAAEKLKA